MKRAPFWAGSCGLVTAAMLWAACSSERDLTLQFWPGYIGGQGLLCQQDDGGLLIARAKSVGYVSVVVDLIGVPLVTNGSLDELEYACDAGCPFLGSRWCYQIPLPDAGSPEGGVPGLADAKHVASALEDAGPAGTVTSNAPDTQLFVRAVITTQGCEELLGTDPSAGFDTGDLVGCAISPSFNPSTADGPITLDLDTLAGEGACVTLICDCAEASSNALASCASVSSAP